MNDYNASHEVGAYGTKIAVGAGVGVLGAMTLDRVAIIAGIACSLVVTLHTLWRWWSEWSDRAARKRQAEPEPWV